MKLNDEMTITKRSSDSAFYGEHIGKKYVIETTADAYPQYEKLYNIMRATSFADRARVFKEMIESKEFSNLFENDCQTPCKPVEPPKPKDVLLTGLGQLIKFFSEFSFTPSFRFTNTFAFMAKRGLGAATEYVHNYFALMDSSYVNEVNEKMQSIEFRKIVENIAQYGEPKSHINTRLKIYYGNAGTGKTTKAQAESDNRCIVCNSSMLPSDLMEDFIFKDGNPDFNPSLLWNCMEQGKTIVLDEINLLPFDSLRFLQGIVDGKTEFYYKNRPVRIADGFQIIGTMNLSLGGMVYGLPEPLVDRCVETKEFALTAEQLLKAIESE